LWATAGMHFGGGIPFYDSLDLVRTKEQGIAVAEIMGDKLFVLMKNHGNRNSRKVVGRGGDSGN